MISTLVNAEFSIRLRRALQIIPAYAYLEGIPIENVQFLAGTLLDLPGATFDSSPGCSGLNADQAPMQLCITLAQKSVKLRLIADPASDDAIYSHRYLRAKNALRKTFKLTRTQELEALLEDLLKALGPQSNSHLENFRRGVFWLAASVNAPGIAAYLDTSVYSIDRAWDKTEKWLNAVIERPNHIDSIIGLLRHYCWLSSVGVEGYDRDRSKLKLYIHAYNALPAGFLGKLFPPLSILSRTKCFHFLLGDIGLPPEDIFYNIGVHTVSGEIVDAKIDISGAALKLRPEKAEQAVDSCCKLLDVQRISLCALLKDYNLAVSFVGVGVNRDGEPRLNIYLKGNYE